jgi:hypothetical protein
LSASPTSRWGTETEIDKVVEFEEVLDLPLDDAPASASAPDTLLLA